MQGEGISTPRIHVTPCEPLARIKCVWMYIFLWINGCGPQCLWTKRDMSCYWLISNQRTPTKKQIMNMYNFEWKLINESRPWILLKPMNQSFMMNQTNQMQPPCIRVSTMLPGEYPWTRDFMLFECKWNVLWYGGYVYGMCVYQDMQMLRVSDLDELVKGRVNFGVWHLHW